MICKTLLSQKLGALHLSEGFWKESFILFQINAFQLFLGGLLDERKISFRFG
jgi:hypothetical protein